MRALLNFTTHLLRCVLVFFRSCREQAIVELALRQQLATYAQKKSKPRITKLDRSFWVALSRFWPRWKDALVIVQPDTVIRGHQVYLRHSGFRYLAPRAAALLAVTYTPRYTPLTLLPVLTS
jgi:hypothetical protein